MNRLFLFFFSVSLTFSAPPVQTQQAPPAEAQVEAGEHVTPGGRRAERNIQRGVASFYARSLHGNRTANGERYDHNAMTVAHRSLPFGTLLRVEDARTGKRVMVRVNDRGPFVRGRVLDLSGKAARQLGIVRRGTARVEYEIVAAEALPSRQPPPPRKVKHV